MSQQSPSPAPAEQIQVDEYHSVPGMGGIHFEAFRRRGWRNGMWLEVTKSEHDGVYVRLPQGEFPFFVRKSEISKRRVKPSKAELAKEFFAKRRDHEECIHLLQTMGQTVDKAASTEDIEEAITDMFEQEMVDYDLHFCR